MKHDTAATLDLDAALDSARCGPRYWLVFGLLTAAMFVEVFDFVLTSFVLAQVAKEWQLTFGQAGFILLAFGFGTIVGSAFAGWAGDRFGRKRVVVPGCIVLALSAGACALVPDQGWVAFGVLRFVAGCGFAGAGTNLYPLLGEITPGRHRTLMTSALGISSPLALAATSAVAGQLLPVIGWRGVAALAFASAIVPILLAWLVPESPRWLALQGRTAEARSAFAALFGNTIASRVDWPAVQRRASTTRSAAGPLEVLRHPRALWLVILVYTGASAAITGLVLWGPLIVGQVLDVSSAEAANVFFYVGMAGFIGRLVFTALSQRIGRLRVGYIMCFGSATFILLAAYNAEMFVAGISVFVACLAIAYFLLDGGYVSMLPYAAEVYPVALAARAMGVGSAALGVGRILGPLGLAVFAGTSNFISPAATLSAVLPGFGLLALCCLIAGLAYAMLGVETHRQGRT